jgi:hypothetical protein
MMPRAVTASCTAAALALLAAPGRADPPTKAQCIEANAKAQELRRDSKLAAARKQLEACMDAACPGLVRSDCTARLDEVDRAQPTLVLDVKDRAGDDLTEVKVTVDGEPLAAKLDGTALRFDPGQHTFGFDASGFQPVTKIFVLKETEKGRRERVVLVRAANVASTEPTSVGTAVTTGAEQAPGPEPPSGLGAQRWLGIVAGGVGLAGIATGAVFGLMASSEWNAQQSACGSPSSCPDHDGALSHHANLTTDGAISTWTFIGGGALVAGGALLFLAAPRRAPPASSALVVAPGASPRSVSLALTGSF